MNELALLKLEERRRQSETEMVQNIMHDENGLDRVTWFQRAAVAMRPGAWQIPRNVKVSAGRLEVVGILSVVE